jgi:hypothetical protein
MTLGSSVIRSRSRGDIHAAAVFIELYLAVFEGEEGPIATGADVQAGDKFGAALADDDAAGGDMFATESFYAEALCIAVTAISATALTFFMSHIPLKFNFFDF